MTMDYEFRRDLNDCYHAEFSMGHEAMGLWLVEELASDLMAVDALLEKIDQVDNQHAWAHRQSGREFVLTMDKTGVEVRATLLDDVTDEAPDELSHYDQESQACCGLDDFRQLLLAWREFVSS